MGPEAGMKGWVPTSVLAMVAGIAVIVAFSYPGIRYVAHRVEVTGSPGNYVEFVEFRSVLFRGDRYWIYFDNESYSMVPLLGPVERFRKTTAEYDGARLTVIFPGGASLSIPGWMPPLTKCRP
jgi:hypothetical protein